MAHVAHQWFNKAVQHERYKGNRIQHQPGDEGHVIGGKVASQLDLMQETKSDSKIHVQVNPVPGLIGHAGARRAHRNDRNDNEEHDSNRCAKPARLIQGEVDD